jgi:hypothetical protein
MLMQTPIMIARLQRPFKSILGNKIDPNNKPDKKPNKFAKLSIIGRKPTKNNTNNVIVNLKNTTQGFLYIPLNFKFKFYINSFKL